MFWVVSIGLYLGVSWRARGGFGWRFLVMRFWVCVLSGGSVYGWVVCFCNVWWGGFGGGLCVVLFFGVWFMLTL